MKRTPGDEALLATLARGIAWMQHYAGETLVQLQDGNASLASQQARRCQEWAGSLARLLTAQQAPLSSTPQPVEDLEALKGLDTPAARELLSALESLLPLAERVDAQRGRVVAEDAPVEPDETRGTDLAEALATIVLVLRLEVLGPAGLD